MKFRCAIIFAFFAVVAVWAEPLPEREKLFAIPSVQEQPIKVDAVSEKEENGVSLLEFYLDGPVFNGQPTRIYAFYARPRGNGPFPAVVQLHGSGLEVLKPDAAVGYAANGYACISIDWAGPDYYGKGKLRQKPFSEFNSPGNRALQDPATQAWKIVPPEQDARTNGVRFIRRTLEFLRSRPEVDASKLCISGMSAGAQATLVVLGLEPGVKAAAVKYGAGFVKELNWGGAYGPIVKASRNQPSEADRWIALMDPKHGLAKIHADTLMFSGTDDVFYYMPAVLATWRAIPARKALLMLPNDSHTQVANEIVPRQWFDHVLKGNPEWPKLDIPTGRSTEKEVTLAVKTEGKIAKLDFWMKRTPRPPSEPGSDKSAKEKVRWQSVTAVPANGDGIWCASLPALMDGEHLEAYATAENAYGVKASSDIVELPKFPESDAL